MRRVCKIAKVVLLTVFLTVYVLVALINYSVVQSVVGSVAGTYFSNQWGGKVKVAAIGANPFDNMVVHGLEMLSPTGDTICNAKTIKLKFSMFPVDKHGITLNRVLVRDCRYHFAIDSMGINLRYIIDYFKTDKEKKTSKEFKVIVDNLVLDGVTYVQDLKDLRPSDEWNSRPGVDVKHMAWKNVNAKIRNLRVDKDHVTCRIDRFTTCERSGLDIQEMMMNVNVSGAGISVTNMVLQTADSRLMGDVLLDYTSWKSMKHFLDSVTLTCHFAEGSYGGMQDAAFWASNALWGMDERVGINGWVGGPVSDLHAYDLNLSFGKETHLHLNGHIAGLPKIDSTIISATIQRLHVTYSDLAAVKHPHAIKMKAEKWIKKLESIDGEVSFSGTIRDFYATTNLQTAVGDINADLVMAMNPKSGTCRYMGELSSPSMRIGRVVPNEWVSRSGLDLVFEGDGFDPRTMHASAEGTLKHTVLRGQRLSGETALNIEASGGKIVADVSLDDEIADMALHGEAEMGQTSAVYRCEIDAEHVDLKRLGLWNDTTETLVDLKAHGRYRNRSEGNMTARLSVDKMRLVRRQPDSGAVEECRLNDATFTVSEQNYWKSVRFNSAVVDAELTGYYHYNDLGPILVKMAEDYLPGKKEKSLGEDVYDRFEAIAGTRFDMSVTLNDMSGLMGFFMPNLHVAPGTSVQANYNFAEGLKPIVRSDSVSWNNLHVYNLGIDGSTMADRYRIRLTSDVVRLGGIVLAETSDAAIESSSKMAVCHMVWNNDLAELGGGDITLRILADDDRTNMVVDPSYLAFGGRLWNLDGTDGDIWVSDSGWHVGQLALVSDDRSLLFKATRLQQSNDSIEFELENFGIDALNPVIGFNGMEVEGRLDGNVRIGFISSEGSSDLNAVATPRKSTPYMNADLTASRLKVGDEQLGDARMQSTWNAEMEQLNLYVSMDKANMVGYAGLGHDDPELSFAVHLDDLGLNLLNPAVKSFSREIGGSLTGDIEVGGTLSSPRFDGLLYVGNAGIMVDMLNVRYMLDDTIHLENSVASLRDFVVRDPNGNSATVNGTIGMQNLNEINLDLQVSSDRLLCMNTVARQSSDNYYGTVIASLEGTVSGVASDINVLLNARTLNGTVLNIPVNDSRVVKQADYIHFVSYDDDVEVSDYRSAAMIRNSATDYKSVAGTRENEKRSNFLLTINVETTPDMKIHLPMDFSTVVLDVAATGSGDLEMKVGSNTPFSLMGDYEMNAGTLGFDLLGVLSKNFSIDEGSSITLPGAVSDAIFDIKAVYSQRVNMSSLTGANSATESQKSIVVENVIALSGTLSAPDVSFDIRLPNADQSVQEEVFAYIDRNNERDMLNQTVSLLLRKRFYSSASSSTGAEEPLASASGGAYELLVGTLGNVVSDMVQVVDVNFDYQAGNALTTDQYAVDISKEWNKFYFESTLGFGGEGREMSQVGGNNNNMTGDMLVGYKINPNFHLFVFNRSNTNDYTRSDLPYKQGVGVKYTRDFDRVRDLFKNKGKKE